MPNPPRPQVGCWKLSRLLALFVGDDEEVTTLEAGRPACRAYGGLRKTAVCQAGTREEVMKASLIVGLALAAAPMSLAALSPAPFSLANAQKPPKPADANFKTPYNSFGQPDISGYWTNVTLTPLVRSTIYGDRAVYTDAEVKTIEGDVAQQHKN